MDLLSRPPSRTNATKVFVDQGSESTTVRECQGDKNNDDAIQLSTSPEKITGLAQADTGTSTSSMQLRLSAKPDIPEPLLRGVPMIKISNRKVKQRTFRLEAPGGLNPALGELVGDRRGIEGYATICWESRKIGRGEFYSRNIVVYSDPDEQSP